MGLDYFNGPSPYDDVVNKICSKNEEDWGAIMNLCDKVTLEKERGAKDCLRAIVSKLSNPNPTVGTLAVTLLRACFNNCGRVFQIECAEPPLQNELSRLLQTKANTPYKVCEAVKEMVQDWVLDFGADPALARIYTTYNRLKAEGYSFPATTRTFPAPPLSSYSGASDLAAREEADLARAIAESLKEAEQAASPAKPSKKSGRRKSSPAVYPAVVSGGAEVANKAKDAGQAATRRVRALYAFEVQEAGELGLVAGDIVVLLDDSHPDWWKGELNGVTGLFPSNYVEPVQEASQGTAASNGPAATAFDSARIDELLQKLLTAQTTATDAAFNADIERLYDFVLGEMHPVLTARLGQLDRKEAELSRLNEAFCRCMAEYDQLQRDGDLALGTPQGDSAFGGYGLRQGRLPGSYQ